MPKRKAASASKDAAEDGTNNNAEQEEEPKKPKRAPPKQIPAEELRLKFLADNEARLTAIAEKEEARKHASVAKAPPSDHMPPTVYGSNSAQRTWEHRFYQLAIYKSTHGHVRFPSKRENSSALAQWVRQQRLLRNELSEEKLKALNALGFIWDPIRDEHDRAWDERYQEILQYKEENGNTSVPSNHPSGLGKWCIIQRGRWKRTQRLLEGKLDEDIDSGQRSNPLYSPNFMYDDQYQRLQALGFQWTIYQRDGWDERIQQLTAYKERFGHCNVPQHWPENKQLGKFVARQRYNYCRMKQGKSAWKVFNQERIDQLDALGFDWGKVRPNTWRDPKSDEAKQEAERARNNSSKKKTTGAERALQQEEHTLQQEEVGNLGGLF